jgi:hypothetical protein
MPCWIQKNEWKMCSMHKDALFATLAIYYKEVIAKILALQELSFQEINVKNAIVIAKLAQLKLVVMYATLDFM